MRRWISAIEDTELRERVRRLMCDLLALPEGPAVNLEPSVSKSKSTGNPPPRSDSLHEKWSEKFRACRNDPVLIEATAIKAEAELKAFKGGSGETDRLKMQRERDEKADIQTLIEHGEGVAAAIISARHSWPIGWVRTVRERNGREPEYGYERPQWKRMDAEERYAMVETLRLEGVSQREAALRLGVSKASVQRYWSLPEAA